MIYSIRSLAPEHQLCNDEKSVSELTTFKEVEDDAKVLAEFLFYCVPSRVVDRALALLKELESKVI